MAKDFHKQIKPKEQLANLRKRFGTNSDYVEVTLYMTFSEMKKFFGKQCDEYEPSCACCSAWLEWHKTQKATVVLERTDIIKLLNTN